MRKVDIEKLKQQLRDEPELLEHLYNKYAALINSMDKDYIISREQDMFNKVVSIVIDRGYTITQAEIDDNFLNTVRAKALNVLLSWELKRN